VKILLAHNSTYYPAHGGGDRSNRLLMEALAARGHKVRVFTRTERFGDSEHAQYLGELDKRGQAHRSDGETGEVQFELGGVDVRVLAVRPELRAAFQRHIDDLSPDIIVTSTDDPGQLLFDLAVKAPMARVVYLVRATIAVPFGPDSSGVNERKTELLRRADAVVGVSHYVAGYVRQWSGIPAVHVPISLLEPGDEYPQLGRFDNRYVSMVNPCAVKGISIFLGLADRMPHIEFAAIPTWGADPEELGQLRRRPNITLMDPVDNIDDLLRVSRVVLVPSVWAEARGRIVVEAMSRGIPVLASGVGGLHEAKLGVPYLLPAKPIRRYKPVAGTGMVPVAEVPEQNIEPWVTVLDRLTSDPSHWKEIAGWSRRAALEYTEELSVRPFETILEGLLRKPKKGAAVEPATRALSDDRRKLLALMLKKKAGQKRQTQWFAGDTEGATERLFCFPWAGGGTSTYLSWREPLSGAASVVAVRLPGREDRAAEPPLDSMEAAVDALVEAIEPYLSRPFSFLGHSMGAVMAFELARRLRAKGLAGPRILIASAARAPIYRLGHQPPPDPPREEFIEEIKRLEGISPDVLADPRLLEIALPALEADARLYRRYVHQPGDPLDIPVYAYRGAADPNIQEEHAARWAEMTTGAFQARVFEGGHFYLDQSREAVLAALRQDLKRG
jgi:surfactin synthase thioesterase subunit/glycosyltransferase involved in cell wall biosynthesis